jgi:hypothetical protein
MPTKTLRPKKKGKPQSNTLGLGPPRLLNAQLVLKSESAFARLNAIRTDPSWWCDPGCCFARIDGSWYYLAGMALVFSRGLAAWGSLAL